MKLWPILQLPWFATSIFSRGLALLALVLMAAIIGPLIGALHEPHALRLAMLLWGFALGALWLLVLPNALVLACDAHTLRLPQVVRNADAALLLYGVLTVLLPALVLGQLLDGGSALLAMVFASIAAGCMVWQLLPYRIGRGLFLGAWLIAQFHLISRLGGSSTSAIAWVSLLAAALVSLLCWRWFGLSRGRHSDDGSMGPPLLLAHGNRRMLGTLDRTGSRADAVLARTSGSWFQRVPNLHRIDRGHPERAIRLALGRSLMPQTLASHLRQWLPLLLILAALIVYAQVSGQGPARDLDHIMTARAGNFWVWMSLVLVSMVPQRVANAVQNRFAHGSRELSLLALLPGLGSAAAQRRALLAASLGRVFLWLAPSCLLLAGIATISGTPPLTDAFLVCLALAAAGWSCACVLACLGGQPYSRGWIMVVWIALLFLILNSIIFGIPSRDPNAAFVGSTGQIVLLLIWATWIIVCAGLSWRGWRALQRRPHPFLER